MDRTKYGKNTYSKADVIAKVEFINKRLIAIGLPMRARYEGRNDYHAIDIYANPADYDRQAGEVRTLFTGQPKQCLIALDAWEAGIADVFGRLPMGIEVVIEVSGGSVQNVYSNNRNVGADILDHDNIQSLEENLMSEDEAVKNEAELELEGIEALKNKVKTLIHIL